MASLRGADFSKHSSFGLAGMPSRLEVRINAVKFFRLSYLLLRSLYVALVGIVACLSDATSIAQSSTVISKPAGPSTPASPLQGERPSENDDKTWQTCPIIRQGLVLLYPGSGAKVQISTSEHFAGVCPAWSPQHNKIAYAFIDYTPASDWSDPYKPNNSPRSGENDGIYIINRSGSHEIHLTNDFDDTPSWSPDGKKIAFTRFRQRLFPEIDIYDFRTGKVSQFSKSSQLCLHPSWSPDGKMIAYTVITSDHWTIYLQDFQTNQATKLKSLPVGYTDFPRWSPHGKKLIFVYSLKADWYHDALYTINSDGSSLHQLSVRKVTHAPTAWSPDGKRIAYVAWTKPGCVALYLCDPSGNYVSRLSPPPGVYYDRDEWPDW
jgi:Tol biopolymer transport system component